MLKKTMGLTALAMTLLGSAANAAEGPCFPGFTGGVKSVVQFKASKNNAKFYEVVPGHLAFLKAEIEAGRAQYGGPLLPFDMKSNPPQAAFLVYNVADTNEVKKIVDKDPMVTNDVFTYSVVNWLQCK